MILSVKPSTAKTKRYMAIWRKPDGTEKVFHFGQPGGFTYVDGASETTRDNYRARHLASPLEGKYIRGRIPSPALFAYWILWGDSRSMEVNIRKLNSLL
jgi:hypothetical protein